MILIATKPSALAYLIPRSLINRRDPAQLMRGVNLPSDWLKQLGLHLSFDKRQQSHLSRHQKSNPYVFDEIARLLYAGLSDQLILLTLSKNKKAVIVKLLTYEIDHCSVGYLNRMQIAITSLFTASQNLPEVIYSTRANLVEKIAIKHCRDNELSIHGYNRVYKIADEALSLGVLVPNAADGHSYINIEKAKQDLIALFKEQFENPYLFFKNILKTIKHELAYFGYNGKRPEYKLSEYQNFKEYIDKILGASHGHTDLFNIDHGKIIDINWDFVHQTLLILIHKSGFYKNIPHYNKVISPDEISSFSDYCRLALIEDPNHLIDQRSLIETLPTDDQIALLCDPKKGLIALSLKYHNTKRIEACVYLMAQLRLTHQIETALIARSFAKAINNNHLDQTRSLTELLMRDSLKLAETLRLADLKSDNLFLWLLKSDVDDSLFLQLPDTIPYLCHELLFSTDTNNSNCLKLAFDHCAILLPILLQTVSRSPFELKCEAITDFMLHIKDHLRRIETSNPDLLGCVFNCIEALGQIENKHRLKPILYRILLDLTRSIRSIEARRHIAFSIYHCMPIEVFVNEHQKPIGLPYFTDFNLRHPSHLMDKYIASLHRRIERNEQYSSFAGFLFGESATVKLSAAVAVKRNPTCEPPNAARSGRLSAVADIFRSSHTALPAADPEDRHPVQT